MTQQVILNFKAAGVDEIVVVTGYQAELVEQEIRGLGVTTLRNLDYATTQMFDSVKIGLSYLQDHCEKILFCPVDVPMFTEATVRQLLKSDGELVFPVCCGKAGHPIVLDSRLVPKILQYEGDCGLRGALDSLETKLVRVPVGDEGILMDADTREDFNRLTELYRVRMISQSNLPSL